MFSSLDRIDIVLKGEPPTYVQTDHRDAAEIEREPELSVLFALTRVLNPKREAKPGQPHPVVLYVAKERPPDFLRRAVAVAGGRLVVGLTAGTDEAVPIDDLGPLPPLADFVPESFAACARAVAAEFGVAVDRAGLAVVEAALADRAGDPDDDEIGYWTGVVQLGSFAGEVIRAANGGRWEVVDSGTLPFALQTTYQGNPATVNPLGKAVKRFANGEEDSLTYFVQVVCGGG